MNKKVRRDADGTPIAWKGKRGLKVGSGHMSKAEFVPYGELMAKKGKGARRDD